MQVYISLVWIDTYIVKLNNAYVSSLKLQLLKVPCNWCNRKFELILTQTFRVMAILKNEPISEKYPVL